MTNDEVTAIAVEDAIKLIAGMITAHERQKWIRICVDFGGNDEGSTANLIMKKAME